MLSNYNLYKKSLALKSTITYNLLLRRAVQWEWSGHSMQRTWECQDQSTMGRTEAERVCDYSTLEPAPASQQEQLSLTFKMRRWGKVHSADCWSIWWARSDRERLSPRQCYTYVFIYFCMLRNQSPCGYIWIHFKYRPFCLLIGYSEWKQGPFYACGILPNTRFYKSVHIYNRITNTQHWIGKKQEMGLIKRPCSPVHNGIFLLVAI